jgi:hypothetical protein
MFENLLDLLVEVENSPETRVHLVAMTPKMLKRFFFLHKTYSIVRHDFKHAQLTT